MADKYILLIDTKDKQGIVSLVSKVLYEFGLNIDTNSEFVDKTTDRFFMRSVVSGDFDLKNLKQSIVDILDKDANIKLVKKQTKDIVLLATKESHVLGDLLLKYFDRSLDVNIKAVVSNHNNLKELVDKFNIPFYHITTDNISREEHEKLLIQTIDKYNPDLIVLAKYMRILTSDFISHYEKKILNIHHSFLPAFIGANPYKQAFERGVKIIGATAHIVTNDLDDGPIIAQDISRVDHSYSWYDMRKNGRDVEKIVLCYALELLLDDKVFIFNNKTIIL